MRARRRARRSTLLCALAFVVVGCAGAASSAAGTAGSCDAGEEDRDGFEDGDSCRDPDNDEDGLPDETDACPNVAEDRDGYQDADGCPESDNDADGVPDETDACPCHPEDLNELEDDDGCPDCAYGALRAVRIEIHVAVGFSAGSFAVEASDASLARLVETLQAEPGLTVVSVHGHAFDEADALALSRQRAEAVRDGLTAAGIDPTRLRVHAHGDRFPLGQDAAASRRVDFEVAETTLRPTESSPCGASVPSIPACGDGEPFTRDRAVGAYILESRYE